MLKLLKAGSQFHRPTRLRLKRTFLGPSVIFHCAVKYSLPPLEPKLSLNTYLKTMPNCPKDALSSATPSSSVESVAPPRVLGHKRRRSVSSRHSTKDCASESCCTTSGESSGDESEGSTFDEVVEDEDVAAKRRRRADLNKLKKSVRRMEAQVVDATAQLKDLAELVAHVVARRQQQHV
ncbi:hypothetical protein PsorP6_014556 [Peronosclerospora sorghi]|uniref:Uncharacterized protein n=1 Tax=Peronosclerospora sorghi TaxID=230839 RepID=A0ACC0VQY6_9STRA|nr:hypothetical protein PsorP6_014556 [Peronosclerospora sorghi]